MNASILCCVDSRMAASSLLHSLALVRATRIHAARNENALEALNDANAADELPVRVRRRHEVDIRDCRLAQRIGTRRNLIDTIEIELGPFREEVLHRENPLMIVRRAISSGAAAM